MAELGVLTGWEKIRMRVATPFGRRRKNKMKSISRSDSTKHSFHYFVLENTYTSRFFLTGYVCVIWHSTDEANAVGIPLRVLREYAAANCMHGTPVILHCKILQRILQCFTVKLLQRTTVSTIYSELLLLFFSFIFVNIVFFTV